MLHYAIVSDSREPLSSEQKQSASTPSSVSSVMQQNNTNDAASFGRSSRLKPVTPITSHTPASSPEASPTTSQESSRAALPVKRRQLPNTNPFAQAHTTETRERAQKTAQNTRVSSSDSAAQQPATERQAPASSPRSQKRRQERAQKTGRGTRASSRSGRAGRKPVGTGQHVTQAVATAQRGAHVGTNARFARRRSAFLILLLILTSLALILWTALNTTLDYLEVQEINLPDFVGQPIDIVEQQAQRLGLEVTRYEETNNVLPDNYVTSQSPNQGTIVRQGRSILLGVNPLRKDVTLLPLVDLSEAEALDILETLHLTVSEIRYVSDAGKPLGTVVASEPESSSVLAPGSAVSLVVSRGPEVARISMPQLVNLSVAEAERRLRDMGVARVDKVLAGIGNNVVVQHVPSAGENVLAKTPVTLYYNARNDNLVWVPNLTGKSVQEAYNAISAAGLTVNSNWLQYLNDPAESDGVVTQYPSVGWSVRNAPVALVVNQTYTGTTLNGTGSPLPSSPTGVGPVSGSTVVSPYGPSSIPRLSDTFANNPIPSTGLQNPTITRPTIDSNNSSSSDIPLLRPNNPPATLRNPPASAVSGSGGDSSTFLTPLPPSQLPLPNSTGNLNLNNPALSNPPITPNAPVTPLQPPATPVPATPAPATPAPVTPVPSAPATSLPTPPATSAPVVNNGGGRSVPINFYPSSYTFLQGRSFRYRLVVIDTQGERTAIDRVLTSSDVINENITVYGVFGEVSIRTFIDEEYFQGWTP